MAFSSFLNINGYDLPSPELGFEYTLSTTVDAGRNVNNAAVGQKIGRDLYKLSSISWNGLDPEVRMKILTALEPFYVPVTFEDYRNGNPITIVMYPGDRKGKPLRIDANHRVVQDDTFTFNLIDAGWE